MSTELKDHVALVTGGGRGIGRAVALALASRAARVAVLARSEPEVRETAREIEAAGGIAIALIADVADDMEIQDAISRAEAILGPIDVLVNGAARCWPIGPFADERIDEWWRTLVVNLRGPVVVSRALLPSMIARKRGRIINIASSARPYAYLTSYVTSKAALVRFSETLALEVRDCGISVFAVGPGTVRTAMAENSLTTPEGRTWIPWFRRIFDEHLDVPMERPVQLICDLASGKADALTGRFLTVFDNLEGLRNLVHLQEIGAAGADGHARSKRDEVLGTH